MRLSERGKTVLAFGTLSIFTIAFEIALLAVSEPLPPSGPIAAAFDGGFARARSGPHGTPGVSVAIVRDGKIAYTYVGGLADVASGTPVTPQTRFRAASITKMFTAIAVLQLMEAGRLGLDDSVDRYLPDAPHASEITIRQLLSHRSGLPNVSDMAFSTGLVARPTTPDALIRPLVSQPLDFAPGTKYEYSNTNFAVLGAIVEKVVGSPLAAVENERILTPAGMTESSFGAAPAGAPAARGYDDAGGLKPTAHYDASWLYGAGDLVTTPSDLARFDIALMNGSLVNQKTLALAAQPLSDMGEGGVKYGLGFSVFSFGTRALVGHHGGLPGFAADDEMIPRSHFAVIVLSNSSDFATASVGNLALAALWPTDFAAAATSAVRGAALERANADPIVEAKLRALLQGIANESLDRTTLSTRMNAALTDDRIALLSKTLPPYATLQSLTFRNHAKQGTYDISYYAAKYTNTDGVYQIVIDADGKIAGFFSR